VVSIAPGVFDTAMMSSMPQEVREALEATVPFPSKLADPADFASLVLQIFENKTLNGEVIRLDGALRMGPR
jgi:NAD(P)-dependent dehydrogenase (short-subunit alcohol dehydrogenase family)